MTWTIEYAKSTRKDIRKIDPKTRTRIRNYLETRIATLDDPRQLGRVLKGEQGELWRYRVGNYRLICKIQDKVMTVLLVRIGHRKVIYRQ